MQVRIKDEICQGHAMCLLACPEIFDLSDEDGHAFVRSSEVAPELVDAVRRAVQSCPEGAIETY